MKKQIMIIAGISVLAGGLFVVRDAILGGGDGDLYAHIHHNSELVKAVPLSQDYTFSVAGIENVLFEVNSEGVAFVKSDCADQVCVNIGVLRSPGQLASCLPNGLILMVVAQDEREQEIDVFVRG